MSFPRVLLASSAVYSAVMTGVTIFHNPN